MQEKYYLNDVQYAFLMGRNSNDSLCGVSCHIFSEYKKKNNCDEEKIIKAWQKLYERHIILKSVISENGEVTFCENNCMKNLRINDFSDMPTRKASEEYEKYKSLYSNRNMNIGNGEVFVLHILKMPDNIFIFFFEGDCIAYDITSYQIFIRDFCYLYSLHELSPVPSGFNPYSNTYISKKPMAQRKEDRTYWLGKSANFGEIPANHIVRQLPKDFSVTAHSHTFDRKYYRKLIEISESSNCHPDNILLGLFSVAFSRTYNLNHFILNIPIIDRYDIPDELKNTASDYTSLMLFDVIADKDSALADNIKRITENYETDRTHNAISGIKVQNMVKNSGYPFHVTFSSHIGIDMNDEIMKNCIGNFESIITQTPKVIMDSEFFLSDENLIVSLVTPDNMLDKDTENNLISNLIALFDEISGMY